MDSTQPIIDLNFGTAQLSGNKALLLSLLNQFAIEYQDADTKLSALIDSQSWGEAHLLVHSIKGIAANLGCSDLQAKSGPLEAETKALCVQPDTLAAFSSSLQSTLSAIAILGEPASVQQDKRNTQREALLKALHNREYIPPDQLETLIAGATTDAMLQKTITEAIDELDYQKAIDLLTP